MRSLLFTLLLATLLCMGSSAYAESLLSPSSVSFISLRPMSRSPLQVSSLLVIPTPEFSVWYDATGKDQHGNPLVSLDPSARRARRPAPFNPMRVSCANPGDPGCAVTPSPTIPSRWSLQHADHGVLPAPALPVLERQTWDIELQYPPVFDSSAPCEGHRPAPWRPPAR